MENKNVIAVDKLRFGYHGTPVLESISFMVDVGEFVGIIGSNGAGKSTLLGLLLGEITAQSGSIKLFGTEVGLFRDWPSVGYVPQNAAAFAGRFPAIPLEVVQANLYSSVGRFRFLSKSHKQRAKDALALVGVDPNSRKMMDELSGGQLQRVLIARALVASPRLLLLDEPTAGVDLESGEMLYTLLQKLHKNGIAIVMVTHDADRCAPYLDRALCVEGGTMVALSREQLSHELSHKHNHP